MTPHRHPHRIAALNRTIVENQTRTNPFVGEQIDEAVAHVFEIMLCQPCTKVDHTPTEIPAVPHPNDLGISATIAISGALQGQCAVHLSTAAAAHFTAILLGPDTNWELRNTDEAVIDDAVRELCNMIAGGWKSRLGPLASACHISVPYISYSVPQRRADSPTGIRRLYAFSGSRLEVILTP
jgi:chemotaxis protein CheX